MGKKVQLWDEMPVARKQKHDPKERKERKTKKKHFGNICLQLASQCALKLLKGANMVHQIHLEQLKNELPVGSFTPFECSPFGFVYLLEFWQPKIPHLPIHFLLGEAIFHFNFRWVPSCACEQRPPPIQLTFLRHHLKLAPARPLRFGVEGSAGHF